MKWRSGLVGGGLAVLWCVAAAVSEPAARAEEKMGKQWVFLGTYTGGKSKGIYRCAFDPATGELGEPVLAAEVSNPSFLAVHPTGRYLYAVNEVATFDGKPTGAVTAFALDPSDGKLKKLNEKPSGGAAPCHVIVDRTGKNLLLANYSGGSVAVFRLDDDGQLGMRSGFVQHTGKGSDPARQEAPHAHSINLDRANRFAVVADLGVDHVLVYRFDADRGHLSAHEPRGLALPPKSGPRHFAFHPDGRHAYVINEMANTITALKYDADKGTLEGVQTVSTLPADYKKPSWTAEVQVHPSGKFVYGSNRGHDSIAVFRVDEKDGTLTPAGHQGEGIKTPRNFAVAPGGEFLLVANQDGDSVLVFRIDPRTGALRPTDARVTVGKPVCVKFVAKK